MSLTQDAKHARKRGLTFEVVSKAGRGKRWETVEANISDLERAIQLARSLGGYESGVFTDGPYPLGGFLYWTSKRPEVYNSTVITQEVYVPEEEELN